MDISGQDWQLISEYIDGELSEQKRVRLERRLESERELRGALRKIEDTRRILRATPHLSAPKDFVLTPDMIPQRETRSFFPVLRLATALVSILLVAVLVLDFGGILSPLRSADYAAPAMQKEAVEKVGEVNQLAEEEEQPAEPPRTEARAEGLAKEVEKEVSEDAEALGVEQMTETPPATETVPPSPTVTPPLPTPIPPIVEERGGLPWIRVVEIILAGLVVVFLIGMILSRRGRRDAG